MSDQTRYQKLTEAIEHLREILNSGATSVSVDGVSSTVDLVAVRRRLNELIRQKNGITKPSYIVEVDVSGGSS